MANVGRLHLATSTSSQTSPAQAAESPGAVRLVVPPLREFKIALETPSQNFIIA